MKKKFLKITIIENGEVVKVINPAVPQQAIAALELFSNVGNKLEIEVCEFQAQSPDPAEA